MYIYSTSIFRNWDEFYKDRTLFKGTLRGTMKEAREEYKKQWWYKYHSCPKSVRRTFKEDYQAFRQRWWQNEVYVYINWNYERETNIWQFQVVVPVYEISWKKIKRIFRDYRWWYPLCILNATKIDKLPREGWEIIPWEKCIDVIWKNWRDSDMFVALSWHRWTIIPDNPAWMSTKKEYANITWTWKPIVNDYNYWYIYDTNWLAKAERPVIQ